jgi:hypothetical protein
LNPNHQDIENAAQSSKQMILEQEQSEGEGNHVGVKFFLVWYENSQKSHDLFFTNNPILYYLPIGYKGNSSEDT